MQVRHHFLDWIEMNARRFRTIRILCADDNELIGEAMSIECAFADDLYFVRQLPSAEGLVDEVERRDVDVVLLDIDMPGPDPFEALEEISRRSPDVKVLILTSHLRSDLIDHAAEAGALGYVSKTERVRTILDAVRRVDFGEFIMSPQVASAAARQQSMDRTNGA